MGRVGQPESGSRSSQESYIGELNLGHPRETNCTERLATCPAHRCLARGRLSLTDCLRSARSGVSFAPFQGYFWEEGVLAIQGEALTSPRSMGKVLAVWSSLEANSPNPGWVLGGFARHQAELKIWINPERSGSPPCPSQSTLEANLAVPPTSLPCRRRSS